MTRLERIQLLLDRGYTCDLETGKVFGINGKEINNIMNIGYNQLQLYVGNKRYSVYAHHFIWYCKYGEIVDLIDHIDENRSNNRIDNLRKSNHSKNKMNMKKVKGYTFNNKINKYVAQISVNGKQIYLGLFDSKEEARKNYLEAKKIYHILD